LAPVTVRAQDGAAARGAATITESVIHKHINVIADDSMLGRDTPSRGLEMTAQYIADNFRRDGLKPGGDHGSYLQRYQITKRRIDGPHSSVRFQAGDVVATASLAREARYLSGVRSGRPVTGSVMLLGGAIDSAAVASVDVSGHIVLIVADFTKPLPALNAAYVALAAHHARALVMISNRETGLFDQVVRRQFVDLLNIEPVDDTPPGVEVHERTLAPLFAAAHLDLAQMRASTHLVTRAMPDLAITVTLTPGDNLSAPNAVGILEGTDPVLRNEYVVFSAHMDHLGVDSGNARDSIYNGADDDGSGTTGVIALAEAFALAPTKRSLIFLTVSGEEKGLWGSEVFTSRPPVPIGQIVADLNIDMIGRNWKDTIVAIGKEHSDLGSTLNRVNGEHPELRMAAIDDIWPQESFYFRSDHYNFAKHGVPILFFFNGTHADYHQESDSPDKIDAEKEARIVRLVYFLGQAVGNAPERPQWDPESYKRIVKER